MKLEIHLLQSFPPANLNRDENGMPKTTQFGGKPRARISSQSQKRATRLNYQQFSDLDARHFAHRSRSWLPELTEALRQQGIAEDMVDLAARQILTVLGGKFEDDSFESKTILFLGRTEIDAVAALTRENWEEIAESLKGKTKSLPKGFEKGLEKLLVQQAKPGDIALFGRMMASLPTLNVDASVQVAHAISVNSLQQEFDFFTAVDDFPTSSDLGADHMGEIGFNSSCYYRYANLDTEQLIHNLGVHADEAPRIARAFAESFIKSVPNGHQNTFAAHTLPALIMVVTRSGQPFSLVDAFEQAVRTNKGESVLEQAVRKFGAHWSEIATMYGSQGLEGAGVCARQSLQAYLGPLEALAQSNLDALLDAQIAQAFELAAVRL
jgi:CRISPR system Cascade subunit CasC